MGLGLGTENTNMRIHKQAGERAKETNVKIYIESIQGFFQNLISNLALYYNFNVDFARVSSLSSIFRSFSFVHSVPTAPKHSEPF
jgi:hypothetical protein